MTTYTCQVNKVMNQPVSGRLFGAIDTGFMLVLNRGAFTLST